MHYSAELLLVTLVINITEHSVCYKHGNKINQNFIAALVLIQ